jgi:hypothetical protein
LDLQGLLGGLDLQEPQDPRDGQDRKVLLVLQDGLAQEVRRWDRPELPDLKALQDQQDLAVLLVHKVWDLRVQLDYRDLKEFKVLRAGQDRKVQVLLLKVKLPQVVTFLQYRLQQ